MNLSRYMQNAIIAGNVNAVKRFLWMHKGKPAAINARTAVTTSFFISFGGDTALTLAIKNKQVNLVSALLTSNDIDVNHCDCYGFTPLMIAAQLNLSVIVKMLLNHRHIIVDAEHPFFGNTALFPAAKYASEEIMNDLLKHGANPNHTNKKGLTAAQAAKVTMVSIYDPIDISM